MHSTRLYDFELPPELIAQHPVEPREEARMMVLDRVSGECELAHFGDLGNYLRSDDLMVFNNTRVIKARLYGRKNGDPAGAKFELLLIAPRAEPGVWQTMLKPGKRARDGVRAALLDRDGNLNTDGDGFTVRRRNDDDTFDVEFFGHDAETLQQRYGHVPLPPYIRRPDNSDDERDYQTVFARIPGAVAAPTAGLHFSKEHLRTLKNRGIEQAAVTLHVGLGTFLPVSVEDVTRHHMHAESFVLAPDTADRINRARAAGRRILAVGTTTVRVLESCASPDGRVEPRAGSTEIFLYPPYRPRAVDMLLTNFHLPQSTLLMLVSTFADREKVLRAYELAVREKFRFFSYGDCMLLV